MTPLETTTTVNLEADCPHCDAPLTADIRIAFNSPRRTAKTPTVEVSVSGHVMGLHCQGCGTTWEIGSLD